MTLLLMRVPKQLGRNFKMEYSVQITNRNLPCGGFGPVLLEDTLEDELFLGLI